MADCNRESMIAAALSQGVLPEELRLHLTGCPTCREVLFVTRNVRKMANDRAEEIQPSAELMWWRLTLRVRREKARQVQTPLVWMARISFLTPGLILTALLATYHPAFSSPVWPIGALSLSAVVVLATIALWSWSRS